MNRTCLEFVTEEGERVIQAWLNEMNPSTREKVEAAIDNTVRYLEVERNPRRPYTGALTGKDAEGLYEIRFKINGVQYRPLFFYGPESREFTLLAGAVEKGGEFKPKSVLFVAQRRRQLAMQDRRYVCEYFG